MTLQNNELVSVLMSIYDGDEPKYAKEAIESILYQTYKNFEFIIVLDKVSKKDLISMLEQYKKSDNRIQIIDIPQSPGLASALNIGIQNCKGELIVRTDADDISHPSRMEKMVNFMLANPEVDAAGSFIAEFKDIYSDESNLRVVEYPCEHEEMRKFFAKRNPLANASSIIRRSFFQKAGLYPIISLRNEDTLLWLSGFVAGCRFANNPEVLYFVRYGKGMISRRIGIRKSFSDFIDRLRVIIDLKSPSINFFFAFITFIIQNMPGPIYTFIRERLISKGKKQNSIIAKVN